MKKIMVTGCNGQLGRAINEEVKGQQDVVVINTDVQELDITKLEEVIAYVEREQPTHIMNCAAHTAVDACETQEDSAYRINAIGPRNLSIAANLVGATMVHVSTDYVFSGDDGKQYREYDQVNPQGVYGRTKLAGELFVKEFAERYFILRTAWLYGEGKNFVKTMLRLGETNDKVRVVGDQYGTPTSAKELAKAMVALTNTREYGTYHATCEGECSWADFAKEIFRLGNLNVTVEAITTEEYNAPTKRPAYSVLDNYMFRLNTDIRFASWQDALVEYMSNPSL
ncbi:MAG: dTDP-4-dehydrorhamnose reductase [Eubacteriales bacterium]